jgi:hypothetical protein
MPSRITKEDPDKRFKTLEKELNNREIILSCADNQVMFNLRPGHVEVDK